MLVPSVSLPVPVAKGGTGLATLTNHALQVGAGASSPTQLGLGTSTQVLHGAAAGDPTWGAVVLTTDVSGILPTANGGTGIAFFTAAGPTAARIYTFPDAACTVLTTNAAVTVAQGGTGLATLTIHALYVGNGTSAPTALAVGASNTLLHGNTGADPSWSAVVEGDLSLTDITTNNVSTTKHGFAPKAPNVATQYLDGTGAYSVPSGLGLVPTATKTGTYTAAAGDLVICDASGGAFNVTLPAATGTGRPVAVAKIDTSGTAVTTLRAGSDTILGLTSGGQTSISVRGEGDIYWLVDIASGKWLVVDYFISPSYCDAYQATQQTGIVTATWTAVTMDAENSDADALHSTVTNNSRITIKKTGEYVITGGVQWGDVAVVNTLSAAVWKNGVGTGTILGAVLWQNGANATAANQCVGVHAILLNGDFVEMGVYQDSGSNKILSAGSGTCKIQVNRVGG